MPSIRAQGGTHSHESVLTALRLKRMWQDHLKSCRIYTPLSIFPAMFKVFFRQDCILAIFGGYLRPGRWRGACGPNLAGKEVSPGAEGMKARRARPRDGTICWCIFVVYCVPFLETCGVGLFCNHPQLWADGHILSATIYGFPFQL
jgi:hypothetical protein